MLNSSGGRVAESRHYPYGAVRWNWSEDGSGTLPTDYRFTGQRDVGLGLTHMGARFLDSALGRWTSADTIVPEPGNPQDFNRYAYVRNSPLRFVDPTGQFSADVVAEYLGCEDKECLEWIATSDWYSTWYWMLRAAEDGYWIDIEDWTGTTYGGQVFLEKGRLKFTGSLAEGLEKTYELPITHNSSTFTLTWFETAAPVNIHSWTSEEEFRQIATGGAYTELKFTPDWGDVGLDLVGALASLVGANPFVNAFKLSPDVAKAAQAVDLGLNIYGLADATSRMDSTGVILSLGGLVPGPVGGGFSLASLYFDISEGFWWAP